MLTSSLPTTDDALQCSLAYRLIGFQSFVAQPDIDKNFAGGQTLYVQGTTAEEMIAGVLANVIFVAVHTEMRMKHGTEYEKTQGDLLTRRCKELSARFGLNRLSTSSRTKHDVTKIAMPSIETRRDMARVLVKSCKFQSIQIDRALNLPKITAAGFMAAAARYGEHVLDVRDVEARI